ncbi:ABATE domain-containing protein [Micromonospora sp. NPDC049044]|uniref:ABATE domain-containing protein n=1 Tax=Micromonospora sp. NPDC049044 TaxID=3154827 RepID=UPI0033DD5E2E
MNTAPGERHGDFLTTPTQLRDLLVAFGEPEPVTVRDADLVDARAARSDLARVFAVAGDEQQIVERLNELLARTARPRLVGHNELPLHLRVDAPGSTWGGWLVASGAMGLSIMVAEHGVDVLAECAASRCAHAVLRYGPGPARRYCDASCANRSRVAAHRAARATSTAGDGGQKDGPRSAPSAPTAGPGVT